MSRRQIDADHCGPMLRPKTSDSAWADWAAVVVSDAAAATALLCCFYSSCFHFSKIQHRFKRLNNTNRFYKKLATIDGICIL